MPPVLIAAAISFAASAAVAAGVIAFSVGLAITLAASVAASLLTKTPSFGSYTSQQERKQVLRAATAPRVYIYGETVTSGLLFFAEEQAGSQDDKEWVHLALAICDHEIESVTKIWLGDDDITTYSGYATWEIHNNRQTADPFMLANCPSWKPDMIGKGITWARISLKFDADKFPAGLPNIKFLVRGKKVYDPRNGLIQWSDNAALCIRDYYSSYLKIQQQDIDDGQIIQAANISDQQLNDGGGLRKRYTINGSFDSSETQSSILDALVESCAGEPTYMAGRHGLLVGAYYGPATLTIEPGQIISDVKIVPEAPLAEKLNMVTGTFLDPQLQYSEVDFPPVVIDQYVNEDGEEFKGDSKYRFVSNEYLAQQLATIKINRTRIGRTLTFTMNLSGYQYRPGYYIKLNLPQMGIVNQEFRITNWAMSATEGVDITLKQETVAIWGDAIGQPIERSDITSFPKGMVPQPINLAYTVQEIGEVVQGVLSWTNVGSISYNIVLLRQNGKTIQSIMVVGESVNLTGMPRGSYTAAVIAVNALGMRSAEAFTIIEIKAPDAPSGCEITQGFFEVTLKPIVDTITNVSTQFDFWTSGKTKLANASTANVTANASRKGVGNMWTSGGLQNDTSYWWYIRSINAFGASEFLEVEAHFLLSTLDAITMIEGSLKETDTYKDLMKGLDDIETLAEATQLGLQQTTIKVGNVETGLTAEQAARIKGDQDTAKKAADDLLAEATARGAAITQVNSTIQNVSDSLSTQISQVSAGTGTQFDSYNIWYFDSGVEGWTGNGTPTIVDGWIRPANHASDPYITSPNNLAINSSSYRFVKMRIKKVGTPTWNGQLRWRSTGGFNDTNMMTVAEPSYDANGIGTLEFDNIGWLDAATMNQIRLDISSNQTATSYFLIDWVAIGRPTPGASTAALERETTARINADANEVTERTTLATQLRGNYTGTDIEQVTSGLIYAERTSRVTADQVINQQINIMEGEIDGNTASINDTLVSTITNALADNVSFREQRAEFGQSAARITQVEKTSADNTQAIASTNLTMETKFGENIALLEEERFLRTTADQALAQRSSKLETDVAGNKSSITTLEQTVSDANEAMAKRVSTVETSTGENTASITDLQQTVTNNQQSNAQSISQIKATADGAAAGVSTNATAIANVDTKANQIAQRVTAVETSTGDNTSKITNLEQTVSNNQQSTALQISQVKAIADGAVAGVSTNATAITNVDTKANQIAQRVTAVETSTGGNSSKITTLEQTVTNNQQSTALQISQVKATADGATAGVQTTSQAVADINGKLQASWRIVVQQGDIVAGIAMGIDNTGRANFMVNADTFTVWNGGGQQAAFMVYNGQAYIRSAFILAGSIDDAKIGDQIRSYDWNESWGEGHSAGWCIRRNGNAWFNNVAIRGTVTALSGSFSGDIYANNGWFRGTVYAEKIEGDITKTLNPGGGETAYISPMPFGRFLSIPCLTMTCPYWTGQTASYWSTGFEVRIGGSYDRPSMTIDNKENLTATLSRVYYIPPNTDAHLAYSNRSSRSPTNIVAFVHRA